MTPMRELPPGNLSETIVGKSGKIFFVFQGRGISQHWQNSPRALVSLFQWLRGRRRASAGLRPCQVSTVATRVTYAGIMGIEGK